MKQHSASVNFDHLFKQIATEETGDNFNVFTLAGKDFFAVTAGKEEHYNSMIGSGGKITDVWIKK